MLKINPRAILYLSQLNRAVLKLTGNKFGISEEDGVLALLKYVRLNPDVSYTVFLEQFIISLSEEEKFSFGVSRNSTSASPSVTTESIPPAETEVASSTKRVRYYRGRRIE